MRFELSTSMRNKRLPIKKNLGVIFLERNKTEYYLADNITNEQTGTGYLFFPTINDQNYIGKVCRLKISYELVKPLGYELKKYEINIEYINLKGTKLKQKTL